ncbi:MAG: HRDC domain-containing protein, partial [Chloroflexi bacterium]|nr:HRDC domain-containing protein [Chloroflexota bacterium]
LGWSETRLRLALGALERPGVVETLSETADEITLQSLQRKLPPGTLERISAALEQQKSDRYRRLGEMLAYLRTRDCRRRRILDYFGDASPVSTSALCCDNCSAPAQADSTPPEAALPRVSTPRSIDASSTLSILHGIDALRPSLGKKRLVLLLRGSEAKENRAPSLSESPLFGALRDCSQSRVERFLDELRGRGLLQQGDEESYFVWTVTARGRQAWKNKEPVDVAPPSAGSTQGEGFGSLREALKEWRTRQARTEARPPYFIFSDRTLREIAAVSPRSSDDLRHVSGLGDQKVTRYGDAILAVVREHAGAVDAAR